MTNERANHMNDHQINLISSRPNKYKASDFSLHIDFLLKPSKPTNKSTYNVIENAELLGNTL